VNEYMVVLGKFSKSDSRCVFDIYSYGYFKIDLFILKCSC
jgi:hypothetical protein